MACSGFAATNIDTKDVMALLLANKAEVNAKNNDGEIPLHGAATNGHKDMAEILVQHGGRIMQ